jgi:hypothetical protein
MRACDLAGLFDESGIRYLFLATASIGKAGTDPDGNPQITFPSISHSDRSQAVPASPEGSSVGALLSSQVC